MIRWLKEHVDRDMIRPLIYKVFTRAVLALFAAELVHFFAPADWPLSRFSNLALILAVLFVLGTVLAWLRLDGMKIPQFRIPRLKRVDPAFMASDIADHIDDDIVKFEDLDDDEQNVCVFLADIILAVVCLILALLL